MKTMKLATAATVVLAAALTGCTAAAPEPTPVEPASSAVLAQPLAAPTTVTPLPTEWTGTFVSQGAATAGTITIRRVGEKLTLTLTNFSTGHGEENAVTVTLNPGSMTKDADGSYVVEDPTQYVAATLKSSTGDQSYDLPMPASTLPELHSATIFYSLGRVSFGSASLSAKFGN